MEIVVQLAWMVAGLALLYFGAEWLVRGSVDIALRLGVSALVVGLTVVSFGTSAPELLVSLQATLGPVSKADIAVGNVIGSNICNIALLLGIAALIRPLKVGSRVVRRELPILCVVSVVFVAMLWDRRIERWEGAVLVAGICIYLWTSVRFARKHPDDPFQEEVPKELIEEVQSGKPGKLLIDLLRIAAGLGLLVLGAKWLVDSGVVLARLAGVSEAVIALTLVAFGTSVPELATTVVASMRRQADIITGNVVGSNLFNMMLVIGLAVLIKPMVIEHIQVVDLVVMLAVTFVMIPFLVRDFVLNRLEGALLLLGYASYMGWLFWSG